MFSAVIIIIFHTSVKITTKSTTTRTFYLEMVVTGDTSLLILRMKVGKDATHTTRRKAASDTLWARNRPSTALMLTALMPIRSGSCSSIMVRRLPLCLSTRPTSLSVQSVQYRYSPAPVHNIHAQQGHLLPCYVYPSAAVQCAPSYSSTKCSWTCTTSVHCMYINNGNQYWNVVCRQCNKYRNQNRQHDNSIPVSMVWQHRLSHTTELRNNHHCGDGAQLSHSCHLVTCGQWSDGHKDRVRL